MINHQALQAHQKAHDAGILHRDIGVGNIMIREPDSGGEREALLVDWDMAKFIGDNIVGTMERTGTWQFLAARFLRNPEKNLQAGFDDDLESFVYVLTWVVFLYTDVDFSPPELHDTINTIFNKSYLNEQGKETGGIGKLDYLGGGGPGLLDRANIKNKHLRDLLRDCKDVMAVRYEVETPDMSSLIPQSDVQRGIKKFNP